MFNTKKLLGVAAASSITLTLVASANQVNAADGQGSTDTPASQLEALVTAYEGHNTFRGVDLTALDGNLELGVVSIDVGDSDGGVEMTGFVDLGLNEDNVHLVAASDGPGMDRFGIVVHDGDVASFRFAAEVPDDAVITHEASGAITVSSSEGETTLAPATAVDADGERLSARYQLLGEELVVDVDLDGAAFPVLIDPVSSAYWWGTQTWYSRADVRASASWYGVIRIANAVCYAMPGWARTACLQTVGAYTNWIYNTWMDAKAYNQCLWMKMTWTGQVIGIGRYACNWG